MTQPQTVVVMVPQGQAAGTMAPTGGGEAGVVAGQTVVVVQNGVPIEQVTDRYSRTGFIVFSVGLAAWNFVIIFVSLGFTFAGGDGSFVAFLCVFIPSVTVFTLAIIDSTIHCNNPAGTHITKICCCPYTGNSNNMVVPAVMCAVLRIIFWIWLFGNAVDVLGDNNNAFVDNVFFLFLSMTAFDTGPIILLAIDFYYYYKKQDYEGIFGHKIRPLRVVIAQSILILVITWSFVLLFNGVANEIEDLNNYIWQWIVHGVVSIVIFLAALWMQFGGQVEGNIAKSPFVRYASLVCGVGQLIVVLLVIGDMFSVLQDIFGQGVNPGPWPLILWLIFVMYYGAITIPVAIGLLSIKTE